MTQPIVAATHIDAPGPEAFAFVEELAHELSTTQVDLPSFPAIVARIRRALADERMTTAGIARIVAAEPALATRVLLMANSTEALNFTGSRVSDLPAAVARLGMNTVRTASIAFAFEQMKKAEDFKAIATDMQLLWQRSILLAALSHVTARRLLPATAAAAMLAGLLHGVGKLYILSRAAKHPRLSAARAACQEIVHDWHASVAKALLESWEMPEDIVAAVYEFENPQRELRGSVQLTDVLAIASLLSAYQRSPERLEIDPQVLNSASRLKITRDDCEHILRDSQAEVAELLTMLGPLHAPAKPAATASRS
jgi:HD-like signal output (HDOD) protein